MLALLSNLLDKPIPWDLIAFGEVGLAGEVRPVGHAANRAGEASRMGFRRIVLPRQNAKQLQALDLPELEPIYVRSVADLRRILV
jgi:DNA repair protein RadA/Sms